MEISHKEIIGEGLVGYVDASHTDYTNGYSTEGFVYFFDGTPISWMSRRQSIIAPSSSLAEYIGFDMVVKEGLFLAKLAYQFNLQSFQFDNNSPDNQYEAFHTPILIRTDSDNAIAIMQNEGYSKTTKWLDVCIHFVRHAVKKN